MTERLITPQNPMGFQNVLTGLCSIWPALCYLAQICPINSGRKQFLPLYTSRIGFLTLAFVGTLPLTKCGLEPNRRCPIFAFSDVQPTLTFLKSVARNMVMEKSTVAQSTHISLGMINRTPFIKFGTRQTIPLSAQGTSFLTKLYIIRMKATSMSYLSLLNHLNSKIQQYLILQQPCLLLQF